MTIINITRGTVLARRGEAVRSLWHRYIRQLFTDSFLWGEGLLIEQGKIVHTFGRSYCIDIIFVNTENIILKVVQAVKPYRIATCPGSAYVVELPLGTLERTTTKPGDKLEIRF